MIWEWPQITMASLIAVNVLLTALLDGRERTGKHSGALAIVGAAGTVALLYFGGFWTGS